MPFFYTASDHNYQIYCGIDSDENDLLAKYGWPNDILFHVSNLSSGHVYLRTPFDCIDMKLFKKVKTVTDFFKHFKIPLNVIEECLHLTKASSIKGSKMDSVNIDVTPWLNVEKVKGTKSGTIHFRDMKYVTVLNVTYSNAKDAGHKDDEQKSSKKGKGGKHDQKSKGKKKGGKFKDEKKRNDDDFLDGLDDSSSDEEEEDKNKKQTKSNKNVYNKGQWKKRLKALDKTKEVVSPPNVEKYLLEQQRQKNESMKAVNKEQAKQAKEQRKKERQEAKKAQDLLNYVGVFDHADMTSNQNMTEDFEDSFM